MWVLTYSVSLESSAPRCPVCFSVCLFFFQLCASFWWETLWAASFTPNPPLQNLLVGLLIDETRQTLWGYFIKLSVFWLLNPWWSGKTNKQRGKNFTFPDLLCQAAVGVTFSYAATTDKHAKKSKRCIIQKFGPAQMSKGKSICCCKHKPGTDKRLIWVKSSEKVRAGI